MTGNSTTKEKQPRFRSFDKEKIKKLLQELRDGFLPKVEWDFVPSPKLKGEIELVVHHLLPDPDNPVTFCHARTAIAALDLFMEGFLQGEARSPWEREERE